MPEQDVTIKPVNEIDVFSIRDTVPTYGDIGGLFDRIFADLGKNQLQPAGPPIGIYHDQEHQEKDVDIEIATPLSQKDLDSTDLSTAQLPAVKEMACVFHQGGYCTIGASYGYLMKWVEENGYRIIVR